MEKREAAKILFMEGDAQGSIAKILGVSEVTLSKWATEGDWKTGRMKRSLFEQTSREQLQQLAEYQLKVLTAQKETLEKEGDLLPLDAKAIRDLISLYDRLVNKGVNAIRWEQAVRIMRWFMEHLQNRDAALAKLALEHADVFINELRKQMQE